MSLAENYHIFLCVDVKWNFCTVRFRPIFKLKSQKDISIFITRHQIHKNVTKGP